jgi:hypothetical protein
MGGGGLLIFLSVGSASRVGVGGISTRACLCSVQICLLYYPGFPSPGISGGLHIRIGPSPHSILMVFHGGTSGTYLPTRY